MGKSLVLDDTIITVDTGENRMYLRLTPTIRLRSGDQYQVVLEQFRASEPIRKHTEAREDWFFEGYFPNEKFFEGSKKSHNDVLKSWGRKLNRPVAVEHAIQEYWRLWQHINTSSVSIKEVSNFIKEAKAHEFRLSQEKGARLAEVNKTKRAKNKA